MLASEYGHLHIVKKLIKTGVTVDQQSKVGIHTLSHIITEIDPGCSHSSEVHI